MVIPMRYLSTRTILLALILAGFCPLDGALAQLLPHYDDLRLKTMPYRNSDGERGRTTFHYGRDGRLRSTIWSLDDQSRCSANYHLYDGVGREKEKYREFSDGLTSRETYEYDSSGRRIRERFSRSDGVSGEAEFQWDDKGRLAVTIGRNHKGWFTGRITYTYEGELPAGAAITREGRAIGTIEYEYDPAGHLLSETWRFGEQWSQTFSYEYETIPATVWSASNPLQMQNGRYRTKNENYDYNGQGGGPSSYRYDGAGKLVEKIFERADGLKTVTSFTFDQRGSLVSSHRQYSSGLTADFSYRYDPELRLVEKTFRRSDGATGHERYRYDRLGRLTAIDYRNMDFWLNGTITFDRDLRGRLSAGRFSSTGGQDAKLELATDARGNVTRVRWIFADGTTQTYTFVYEEANRLPRQARTG